MQHVSYKILWVISLTAQEDKNSNASLAIETLLPTWKSVITGRIAA